MLLPTQVQHSFSVCASSFQNLCKKNHVMLRATCPANVKVAVCDLVKKCVFKPQPGSLPGEICCGTIVNRSWSQSLLIVSRGCCNWEISQAGFITSIKSSSWFKLEFVKSNTKERDAQLLCFAVVSDNFHFTRFNVNLKNICWCSFEVECTICVGQGGNRWFTYSSWWRLKTSMCTKPEIFTSPSTSPTEHHKTGAGGAPE